MAPKMEAGKVEGDITVWGVADAVADTCVRLGAGQIDEYERVLKEGKHLLIFCGDADQVTQAYQAHEHSDNDELAVLDGYYAFGLRHRTTSVKLLFLGTACERIV